MGVRPDRIVEIGVGVDLGILGPHITEIREEFTGVYHGAVLEERGIHIILDRAAALARTRRDFRIRIAGLGMSAEPGLVSMIRDNGVTNLIELIPRNLMMKSRTCMPDVISGHHFQNQPHTIDRLRQPRYSNTLLQVFQQLPMILSLIAYF